MGEDQEIKANQATKPTLTHKLEDVGMRIIENKIHQGLLGFTQVCYIMGELHHPVGLPNRNVFKVHRISHKNWM